MSVSASAKSDSTDNVRQTDPCLSTAHKRTVPAKKQETPPSMDTDMLQLVVTPEERQLFRTLCLVRNESNELQETLRSLRSDCADLHRLLRFVEDS